MKIEQGEGFYLGAMALNYGIAVFGYLFPLLILFLLGWIPGGVAVVLALAGAIAVPIFFYRSSRCWWLMLYFLCLPHELPANGGRGRGQDD